MRFDSYFASDHGAIVVGEAKGEYVHRGDGRHLDVLPRRIDGDALRG